jgi:hypothetical protein
MINENEITRIVNFCQAHLDLAHVNLDDAYFYQSLPLCVIDAVFSIGVRYTSTENTVRRYCEYFGLNEYSKQRVLITEQLSISDFIRVYEKYTLEDITSRIYQNHQRTSAVNGILKSAAALDFARVLHQFQVEYFQDIPKVLGNKDFEAKIAEIPGQRSGISTRYFYMLAGSDDYIKPDRMIARFIWSAIQRSLSVEESHEAIVGAEKILEKEYTRLTPRALDYQIWLYQREKK